MLLHRVRASKFASWMVIPRLRRSSLRVLRRLRRVDCQDVSVRPGVFAPGREAKLFESGVPKRRCAMDLVPQRRVTMRSAPCLALDSCKKLERSWLLPCGPLANTIDILHVGKQKVDPAKRMAVADRSV